MATHCPKCSTPSLLRPEDVGSAGRLVSCPACGTTWLARHFSDGGKRPMPPRQTLPMLARRPPIIDATLVPAGWPAAAERRFPPPSVVAHAEPRGRRHLLALSAVLLFSVAVIAVSVLASTESGFAGLFAPAGPVLHGVTSKTIRLRGTEAIFVEGEIVNQSSNAAAVPAVRVSLQSNGAEVYSWTVEPTVREVEAGGVVGFRSAMASPVAGPSEVSLSLADRTLDAEESR